MATALASLYRPRELVPRAPRFRHPRTQLCSVCRNKSDPGVRVHQKSLQLERHAPLLAWTLPKLTANGENRSVRASRIPQPKLLGALTTGAASPPGFEL